MTNADGTALSGVVFIPSDDNGPTGAIQINDGAATTSGRNVILGLAAADDLSGVAQMSFSDDGVAFGPAVPFATAMPYTLPAGNGDKTVYVKFIDGAGNVSIPFSATITLDAVVPTTPDVSVAPAISNATTVQATFSSTSPNGIAGYQLKVDSGSFAPASSPKTITGLSEGAHTVSVFAFDGLGNASDIGSATCTVDLTAPSAVITLDPENSNGDHVLKGDLTVNITSDDLNADGKTEGSGVAKVEVKLDSGDYADATGSAGSYTFDADPITSATDNGTHTVYVRVTDNANNQAVISQDFTVNKNEVSGTVSLQSLITGPVSRDVTFVLDGTDTRTLTLNFSNRQASFSLTDVADGVSAISAKTVWNLRTKITGLSPADGQSTAFFTGSKALLGGDLSADNVVNTIDYVALRNSWGPYSVGDINGDGATDNADYSIMKINMYKKGDPQ